MKLQLNSFRGERPAVSEDSLPMAAAKAVNCLLMSGSLRPLRSPAKVADLAKTPPIKTLFYHKGHWFHWRERVSAVVAPDAGDETGRFLFTFNDGSGSPKVTDVAYGTAGGGEEYPTNAYDLGIPLPQNAPIASLTGAEPGADDILDNRTYIMTYVNGWGQPGGASPMTPNVVVGPSQVVELTNLGTAPNGNHNITHKNIYRTSSGNVSADFLYVATIPVGQTTFTDTVSSDNLGTKWSTQDYDMPPSDLKGLVILPNGIVAGYAKNEVCFCEPGKYYAWPIKYRQLVSGEIAALGVFGQSLVVLMKDGFPYMATGDHPENYTLQRLENGQACIGADGVVDIGYAIAYPGPDGLQMIGVEINQNVTRGIIEPQDWRNMNPSSFIGGAYGFQYVAFYTTQSENRAIIVDPAGEDGGIVYAEVTADAIYMDRSAGLLYFSAGDEVFRWDASGAMTATWTSRPLDLAQPINIGAVRALAKGYPIIVDLLVGTGQDSLSTTFDDREAQRLPGGYMDDLYKIRITTTKEVTHVAFAETMDELQQASQSV